MATKTAHAGLSLVGRTQTDGGDCPSSKFRELAEELRVLLELGNVSLIRDRLTESVGWLRSCADSMEHDEAASARKYSVNFVPSRGAFTKPRAWPPATA